MRGRYGRHLSADGTATPSRARDHVQLQNGLGVMSDAGTSSLWRCKNFLKFLHLSAQAAVVAYWELLA